MLEVVLPSLPDGFGFRIGCLPVADQMALGWLWVALPVPAIGSSDTMHKRVRFGKLQPGSRFPVVFDGIRLRESSG